VSSAPGPARIVICEDSRTYSRALREFLERDDDLRVVVECASAEELLAIVERERPDLVTMDLELPGMDGVEATRRVMRQAPLPILVLSAHTRRGSERAAAALSAGALEAMPKSEIKLSRADAPAAVALRRRVRRLSLARPARRRSTPPANGPAAASPLRGRRVAAIGICSSTGGPHALRVVLGDLPGDFPIPILVVQHMAAGFTDGLVRWLGAELALPVGLAREGAALSPGVSFAVDGAHLALDRARRLCFDRREDERNNRPSGDVLLASLADVLGQRAAAVVLTGLGRDGADGLAAVATAGGVTAAQDEPTSAVYGMPRVARDRGAEAVLALEDIGPALHGLIPVEAA
jgi:two-component system chemotaxis response regulator CheB